MLCCGVLLQPSSLMTGGPSAVVSVAVRKEKQVRRGADPHAPEPQLDPREIRSPVKENRPPVEPAVVVCILEYQDPVFSR